MTRTLYPWERRPSSVSFFELIQPALYAMKDMPELKAKGNRKLKMTFEDQLRALVFFHLEEHTSAQDLLQTLSEDKFAREHVAPKDGIKKKQLLGSHQHPGTRTIHARLSRSAGPGFASITQST